jgi:hypothetical protein
MTRSIGSTRALGLGALMDTLGPTWGLHLVDVNITLGDLVKLAGHEATAWAQKHPRD